MGSTTPDNQKLKDIFGAVFERDVIRFAVFSEHDITLNPNWFSRDDYREIAELFNTLRKLYAHAPSYSMIISALHAKAKQMPRESPVRKNVLKAVGFLNTVTPLTKTQTEFVVDHLSEFARRRSLYLALMESADAWSNGKYDEIMTRIQGALEDSSRYSEPSLGTDFREARARIRAYTHARRSTKNVPTGIPMLDERIRGGMEPGTLGIIMAPAGRGKTMLLVNFGAIALIAGYNVAHITIGDISELVVSQRYDARLSGFAANAFAKTKAGFAKHVMRATQRAKGRLFIKEYAAHSASVSDIHSYLKTLQDRKQCKIDLVIVDYADLIRPSKQNGRMDIGRYRELGDVIIQLRTLASELHAPLWTASQTGRSAYKSRTIGLQDIWESIEKAQHSDIVIGLAQHEEEKRAGRFRLMMLKNRLGGHEGIQIICNENTDTQTIAQAQNQLRTRQVMP